MQRTPASRLVASSLRAATRLPRRLITAARGGRRGSRRARRREEQAKVRHGAEEEGRGLLVSVGDRCRRGEMDAERLLTSAASDASTSTVGWMTIGSGWRASSDAMKASTWRRASPTQCSTRWDLASSRSWASTSTRARTSRSRTAGSSRSNALIAEMVSIAESLGVGRTLLREGRVSPLSVTGA